MQTRTNRRGHTEHFVEHQHLRLNDLKREARAFGLESKYLFKENIPEFPRPEFHVSHLKHDTDGRGLRGIRGDGGFRDPFPDGLVWWSLQVGPEEVEAADTRLLQTTYPGAGLQEGGFLWRFATSPAFLETSRLGSYRFSFPVQEVLQAYSQQFCAGAQPVMRVHETVLYKQEVMYVVLVHSPVNEENFSKYPLLADDPNAVCVYRDGKFLWRPEAMCETHRCELIYRRNRNQMEAWNRPVPQFYVWDHAAIALHVGKGQVLEFDADRLRQNLKYCHPDPVFYSQSSDSFDEAKDLVKSLWQEGLLEVERSLGQSLTASHIRLVLVGRTGVGKSSSGNTILGRKAFGTMNGTAGPPSGSCCLQRGEVFGRGVTIIDTPGLSETLDPAARNEIFRCINASDPAPLAILLVFRAESFPEAAGVIVKQVEEIFGRNVWGRTFVLLTQEDRAEPGVQSRAEPGVQSRAEPGVQSRAEPGVQSRLQEAGPELSALLSSRFQVLNVHPEDADRQQVWDLLHAVGEMVSDPASGGGSEKLLLKLREVTKTGQELQMSQFFELLLNRLLKPVSNRLLQNKSL